LTKPFQPYRKSVPKWKNFAKFKGRRAESKSRKQKMEQINVKIKQKLENYQELYDSNQKLIYIGQKIEELSDHYFNSKNKKVLIGDFLKIIEIENSKRKKATAKEQKEVAEKRKSLLKKFLNKLMPYERKRKKKTKSQRSYR